MLRSLAIALSLILPTSVFAQTLANTLFSQMGLDRMIPVMRQEGLQYGAEIGEGSRQALGDQLFSVLLDLIKHVPALLISADHGVPLALVEH